MIQSVCKNDFRDPKQITQLVKSLNGNKFKSDLEHKNSISDSKIRELKFATNAAKIDVSTLWTNQEKCVVVTDKKTSWHCPSSMNIISCCQNQDEKLFKSMWDGKLSELRNSFSVTEINYNVSLCDFLLIFEYHILMTICTLST